ncbi:MAG: ATP-binding protein, partial [Pseudomonadota bacterium]
AMSVISDPLADLSTMRRALSRRWLPRSFYAQAALILIVPILTIQLAVAVMFLQRHYEDVTIQMTTNLSREIALLRVQPELAEPLSIALDYGPVETYVRWWDLSGRAMQERLREVFPDLVAVNVSGIRKTIQLEFADGMRMVFPRTNVSASNPHQLLVLMVATSLIMTGLSMIFMRAQIQPIRRLARVAQAFGRGETKTYKPSGATEVRAAGTAFLEMRARIERHIEQRTLLLSGVSHDLRTPLTRMRLELSMMDGDEAAALERDVSAMERIIDTFLDFAREGANDTAGPADLPTLIQEAVDLGAPDHDVEVITPSADVTVYQDGMRRAVANLLGNALRYGTLARVTATVSDASLVIAVEDNGPGIPEADRGDAVRPFARLDTARSNPAGNVGLGLSIVRDVARTHGGMLRLGRSDMGGLKAEIVVPQ